jgi:predicted amino acid dehydrogenase
MMDAIRARDVQWVHEKIEEAVVMARDEGCQVVGLGGYTSIVTGNCRRLKVEGIGLTSGNGLTVGVGLCVLKMVASQWDIDLSKSAVAIVGATGNIGSTYASMIAMEAREVVLVVRELGSPRLAQTIEEVKANAPGARIRVTNRMEDLAECSLIVCASNSPVPLVYPEHLSKAPVVICDIAVPGDVSPDVTKQRPDVTIIEGGVVRLPRNPEFTIAGLSLPPGNAYACIAETLLMGLEGERDHGSYGAVTVNGVRRLLELAKKHGFEYALPGDFPLM